MKRTPVTSSSVISVGYDAELHVLEVEFVGGAVYRYFAVPQHVVDDLLAAPSQGRFLNENIRSAYPFDRIPT